MTAHRTRVLVDSSIPHAVGAFATLGDVTPFDAAEAAARPTVLSGAEVLVVRSTTRLDVRLLDATPDLLAVATPIVGLDHVDERAFAAFRERAGRPVPVFHAPGSTAGGVADMALAAIHMVARKAGRALATMRVGICGHGNCGTALATRLRRTGVRVVAYDPPLQELTGGAFTSASLAELLACDAVSLHVPLTRPGESLWPTWHMVDTAFLDSLPASGGRALILVNTSRGEVVDGSALLQAVRHGRVEAALDVWEGEPSPDPDLVAACAVATPHVAGSVFEGRARALRTVVDAVAEFLGVDALGADVGDPGGPRIAMAAKVDPDDLDRLVEATGAARVTGTFRSAFLAAPPAGRGAVFARVRRAAMRHEVDWR